MGHRITTQLVSGPRTESQSRKIIDRLLQREFCATSNVAPLSDPRSRSHAELIRNMQASKRDLVVSEPTSSVNHCKMGTRSVRTTVMKFTSGGHLIVVGTDKANIAECHICLETLGNYVLTKKQNAENHRMSARAAIYYYPLHWLWRESPRPNMGKLPQWITDRCTVLLNLRCQHVSTLGCMR